MIFKRNKTKITRTTKKIINIRAVTYNFMLRIYFFNVACTSSNNTQNQTQNKGIKRGSQGTDLLP